MDTVRYLHHHERKISAGFGAEMFHILSCQSAAGISVTGAVQRAGVGHIRLLSVLVYRNGPVSADGVFGVLYQKG